MASGVLRGPLRALGSPRFGTYWGAQFVSAIADRAYLVAFALQLGVVEHRTTLLAVALAANAICFTVPMLLAGAVIDRAGTRLSLLAADLIRFAGTLVLAVAFSEGRVDDWVFVFTASVVGIGESIFYPAFATAIPELVGPDRLASANSLRAATQFAGSTGGPLIIGVLVARDHLDWAFWAQSLTFLVAAAAAVVIPPRAAAAATRERGETLLSEAIAGGRWALRQRWIVLVILFLFAENLLTEGPRFVLLPQHASSETGLGLGTAGFAWLSAASGAGALVGSLFWGRRERGPGERVRAFAGALLMAGVGWTLAGTTWPAAAYVGMALLGAGIAGEFVLSYSAVQARVAAPLLGRTSAAMETLVYLSGPLSYAGVLVLGGHVSSGTVIIVCGLLIVVCGLLAASGLLRSMDE